MTLANNSTLQYDFNQSPYWDDYNELDMYYRILTKPRQALQSREVNQMQAMLQSQINRFGRHIFVEGSRVRGGEINYDQSVRYVKLKDLNALSNTVTVSNFTDTRITGDTSNVTAIVVDVATGSEFAEDTKTLFVKYQSSGTGGNTKFFIPDEDITANNGFTATVINDPDAVGDSAILTVQEGILFSHDHFLYFPEQTIILDRYTNRPSCRVGFLIEESIVDYLDDTRLLDPASGSYNYAAPGADRFKITATLTSLTMDEAIPANFTDLMVIKDGIIQYTKELTQYADLLDEFARRTYDESGDYVVRGLDVTVRESLDNGNNNGIYSVSRGGNTEQLVICVSPGVGYVKGYDYTKLVTEYLPVDKGVATEFIDSVSIAANYGNYVLVDEAVGYWNTSAGSVVSLYDTAQNRVSTIGGSTASQTGSLLGTARVRAFVHDSGTPGTADAQYRLYLYDLNMSADSFRAVRSVYVDNASGTDAGADTVVSSNVATLVDQNFVSMIFPLTSGYTKSIRADDNTVNLDYQYIKTFNVTIATDGTFNITVSGDETFPYSAGSLNSTQIDDGIVVTLDSAISTSNLSGTVQINSSNTLVIGSSTNFSNNFRVGDLITVGSDTRTVVTIDDATHLHTNAAFSGSSSGNTFKKSWMAGQYVSFTGVGSGGSSRSVTVNSSTNISFALQETLASTVTAKVTLGVQKTNIQEKQKLIKKSRFVRINCGTHSANTVGPYCLGFSDVFQVRSIRKDSSDFTTSTQGTDVTSSFLFDRGQRLDMYGPGYILPDGITLANTDYLLVELDYFQHSTSIGDGYLTVNSYPIDDVDSANTDAIQTYQIPVFGSYNLRDCIDCRPRIADTATDTQTVTSSTTNPTVSTSFTTGGSGLLTPVVNETFNFDMTKYLGRIDLVTMNRRGQCGVTTGIPSSAPVTPATPNDAMALAKVYIAPYPSLPQDIANIYGRTDYSCAATKLSNRVYTMRDIGVLDQRITNLEKYTLLSLLEKDTATMQILDSNGLNRYKNGFLVDPFTSHTVGSIFDVDYHCAMDPTAKELRPEAKVRNVNVVYNADQSSNIMTAPNDLTIVLSANTGNTFTSGETVFQGATFGTATATGVLRHGVDNRLYIEEVTGSFTTTTVKGHTSNASATASDIRTPSASVLATLPYTHEIYCRQPFATTTRNAAGLEWSWIGDLELIPSEDVWIDTTFAPDRVTQTDGDLAIWQAQADAWGTQWGSWNTYATGTPISETTTIQGAALPTTGQVIGEGSNAHRVGGRGQFGVVWMPAGAAVASGLRHGFRVVAGTDHLVVTTGSQITTTTTTPSQQIRTGSQAQVINTGVQTQVVGETVLNVSLAPFMRSRRILVRGHGLKPNTKFFPFFDSQGVSSYCTPISVDGWDYFLDWSNRNGFGNNGAGPVMIQDIVNVFTPSPSGEATFNEGEIATTIPAWYDPDWIGARGGDLISDAGGRLLAFFDLPNDTAKRFAVGTKIFRLSDSVTNSDIVGEVTTSAQAQYTAHGLINTVQRDIVATQTWDIAYNQLTETRSVDVVTTQTTGTTSNAEFVLMRYVDPIGQSIPIDVPGNNTAGIFVTKVDLYLQTKDSTMPLIVMLREMEDSATIGRNILPFSKVRVYPDDMHISEDGTKPTVVAFQAPVFLKAGAQYALVVQPAASSPNYNVWTSKLGQSDVATAERVIRNPYVGILYVSANDITYSAVQDEDLKFTLYRAKFNTSVTGTFISNNQRHEFLTIDEPNVFFSRDQEQIRGPLSLRVYNQSGTANTGEYAWGTTSNAYGQVVTLAGSNTYTLQENEPGRAFLLNEPIEFRFANNSTTGATGTVGTFSLPVGWREYYSYANNMLILSNVSNVGFSANDVIRGQTSNATATVIDSIGIAYDTIQPQITQLVFPETSIAWYTKGTVSASHTLDSSWLSLQPNYDFDHSLEKIVYSASYEDTYLSGGRSLRFQALLESDNEYLSPVVDISKMQAILVYNIINNTANNETNARGGDASARYITKTVTLEDGQDAEDLRVYVATYQPPGTEVLVYAKYLNGEDSDRFDDRNWVEMESTNVYSSLSNKGDFRDQVYTLPDSVLTGDIGEVQYTNSLGVTFTSFKYFAIKIVLISSSTALVPRCRDLRVIALQK